MTLGVTAAAWPRARWGEALAHLREGSGKGRVGAMGGPPPRDQDLDDWLHRAAASFGLGCDALVVPYRTLEQSIATTAPALWKLPDGAGLLVLRSSGSRVWVLTPTLQTRSLPTEVVRRAICARVEAAAAGPSERFERILRLGARRRAAFRHLMTLDRVGGAMLRAGWGFRIDPGASFLRQLRGAGLLRSAAAVVVLHAMQYLLWLLAWAMVGRAALSGRFEPGWFFAWALTLLTVVPIRMATRWKGATLGLRLGRMLKQRLLVGALRLDLETGRAQGSGQLLGRVLESSAVETLLLSGGLSAITAVVELLVATVVLALGAGGLPQALALVAWVAAALALAWRYALHHRSWTRRRFAMTSALTEKMLGQRTRIVQEPVTSWHTEEDVELGEYLQSAQRLDRDAARLAVLIPRGWMVLAVATLAPSLVLGDVTVTALAIAIGGVLLARQALLGFSHGITALANAAIAWEQIRALFEAAGNLPVIGDPKYGVQDRDDGERTGQDEVLLQARGVTLTYPGRREPALAEADLVVRRGDRVLLEGESGGGKSTLAAVLLGLRTPDKGSVIVHGLDRQTLGDQQWHRLVGAAPQFHQNHVFTGTFAYNLLMGRQWPPEPGDLQEAEEVCRELGLGELIDRMPAGMLQAVGETGWQLSHGERSRMYIARALLQHGELIVLDESLAALDPHNLQRALDCAFDRAPSLLVIAHP